MKRRGRNTSTWRPRENREELGTDLVAAAKRHSAKAAQWQVNHSIRALVNGPTNTYTASQNLANILAAREMAARGDAGEGLTNKDFRERAEQLQTDPAFQRMAALYTEDPAFRRRIDRGLAGEKGVNVVQAAYERAAEPVRVRRSEQPQPQRGEIQEQEAQLAPVP